MVLNMKQMKHKMRELRGKLKIMLQDFYVVRKIMLQDSKESFQWKSARKMYEFMFKNLDFLKYVVKHSDTLNYDVFK